MKDKISMIITLPNSADDPTWLKAYNAVVGDEATKKAALWDFIQIVKAIGVPILNSDQIKEIRREERERIKKMVRRACDLGDIITSRQRDMIVAGIDSEAVIREMGNAP